MQKKVLISRPKMIGDSATASTFEWGKNIIKEAALMGYGVLDYKKQKSTNEKINKALLIQNPDLFIHLGHGCQSSLIGQNDCIIACDSNSIDTPDDINCISGCLKVSDVSNLKNKHVIAYACHSSKNLGICAMRHGAISYAGFDDYLMFIIDTKKTEKIFVDCILTYSLSLLNGDTIGTARDKTLEKFDYYIKKYKNVKWLALILLWDRESFKVYGNDDLTIFS